MVIAQIPAKLKLKKINKSYMIIVPKMIVTSFNYYQNDVITVRFESKDDES